jgi:ferrous iron transport protein A
MRLQMRTVLIDTVVVNAGSSPVPDPGFVSLAALSPGTTARVVSVGSGSATVSPLERRLLELGFVHGEQVEILAEARPGRDPFVVRVGHTTLALRRREAQSICVELQRNPASESVQRTAPAGVGERVELPR